MERARRWCRLVLAAILAIALGGFLGCSPQKRYEVLSFFFDGVPVPQGVQGSADAKLTIYHHKPYADGKCGACHTSDVVEMDISRPMTISEVPSSTCLRCHEKVRGEYPVMHGPVSATECLMCHAPHDSTVAHLLKAAAPLVCVQCHTPDTMVPRRPEHQDEKSDCLSCHVAHGGPKHGLLQTTSTTRPATRPAVSSLPGSDRRAGL